LDLLDSRFGFKFPDDGIKPVVLYCTNKNVEAYNEKELAKLTTEKNKTSKKKAKKIKISATPKIAVTTSKSTYKPIKIRRTTAKKLKLSTIGKKQKIAKPDIKKLKLKLKV
jgi:hypothetical protein